MNGVRLEARGCGVFIGARQRHAGMGELHGGEVIVDYRGGQGLRAVQGCEARVVRTQGWHGAVWSRRNRRVHLQGRRCSIKSTELAGHGVASELVRGSGLAWLVLVAKGHGEAWLRCFGTVKGRGARSGRRRREMGIAGAARAVVKRSPGLLRETRWCTGVLRDMVGR